MKTTREGGLVDIVMRLDGLTLLSEESVCLRNYSE
jgi:hypothetical protein